MSNASRSSSKLLIFALALAVVAPASKPVHAQNAPPIWVGHNQITGIPEDWSHHHLLFSDPGTADDAIRAGRYNDWFQIVNEPRYLMQQFRRNSAARGPYANDVAWRENLRAQFAERNHERGSHWGAPKPPKSTLKQDWNVNLTTSAVMPNTSPAKYNFDTTGASCSDYVAYPTGYSGTSNASIIAYYDLYTGTCSQTGGLPNVWGAYNTSGITSTTASVTTSPVLSSGGTMIAYVQASGGAAWLVVLKLKTTATGSLGSPTTPTTSTTGMNCTGPCAYAVSLSHASSGDTYSSPYYDYANDAIYVGDNNGYLYKISPVFTATSTPSPSSIHLNATTGALIASPVYDPTSGCVFVGDTQGYLYSVNSGVAGAVCTGSFSANTKSEQLSLGGDGIFDGVLVDPSAQMVYAFVTSSIGFGGRTATIGVTNFSTTFTFSGTSVTSADVGKTISGTDIPTGTTIATVSASNHNGTLSQSATGTDASDSVTIAVVGSGDEAVVQYTTTITSGEAPNGEADLGAGADTYNLYAGTFDNTYMTSSNAASPSGNIWVIGNDGATGGGAALYRVPISSNVLGASVSAVTVNSAHPGWATPVTEFYNSTIGTSGTDSIYFSVNHSSASGCTNSSGNGCVLAYTVSGTSATLSGHVNSTYPGSPGCWGTSAFIIDNSSTSTGASQIYYMYFGGNSPSTTPSTCTSHTTSTVQAIQIGQSTL